MPLIVGALVLLILIQRARTSHAKYKWTEGEARRRRRFGFAALIIGIVGLFAVPSTIWPWVALWAAGYLLAMSYYKLKGIGDQTTIISP
jgi:hypothetical protein